ncbi:MAG: ATP-binding cassette domain-containing protein [Bdellovibrionales bacterium]|nr:ATP-binding cassette domain-containing protein [Bdellovibrionales bacterium]
MTLLYEVKDLSFNYQLEGVQFQALKKVNLKVSSGDVMTFAGPSGSGKSTLLNLMGLMEETANDTIFYHGKCMGRLDDAEKNTIRRFDIGFIFQSFHLFPVLTTYENIEFFLIRQGVEEIKRRELVHESMEVLGITDLQHKRPLSSQVVSANEWQLPEHWPNVLKL